MKIMLVNIKDEVFNTSVAAISAVLKKNGRNAQLVSIGMSSPDVEYFREEVSRARPDVVLFSVMSAFWPTVKKLSKIVKQTSNSYVICGGYHASLFPEDTIAHDFVDAICLGEGDLALPMALDDMERETPRYDADNFWFKVANSNLGEKKIIRNNLGNLVEDLDLLPDWDREIFGENMRHQTGTAVIEGAVPGFFPEGTTIVEVYSGKGCPYSCTYCSNAGMRELYKGKGKFVRRRSVDNLIREMKKLQERFNADFFDFMEEAFSVRMSWLEEFREKYKKEVGIPFCVPYRVEQLNRERLELLSDAGCTMMYIGVESGNEEYRKKYLNRKMTNEMLIETASIARSVGIHIISLNMVGLPLETEQNIQETLELNRKIEPAFPFFFTYQLFPKTALYDFCREHDLVDRDTSSNFLFERVSWIKNNLPNATLDKYWEEIEQFQMECLAKERKLVKSQLIQKQASFG